MIKVKDPNGGGYRFELCPPPKYHEKARPLYSTIRAKMNKLESISPAKFSKFKQYLENLQSIHQCSTSDPKKMLDMICKMVCSLLEEEDDQEFRNELCFYLLEKFLLLRLLSKKCSQAQAEEEFQNVFWFVLRKADDSLQEYLKPVYPELYQIFDNSALLESEDPSFRTELVIEM